MELVFLILIIVGVFVVASEISSKKVSENPTAFGNRLQSLAKSGKKEKLRELLIELPDWPVRGLLVSAAENLGELWLDAALAEPAGVPAQTAQLIILYNWSNGTSRLYGQLQYGWRSLPNSLMFSVLISSPERPSSGSTGTCTYSQASTRPCTKLAKA